MVQLVVILTTAFILIPLIELASEDRIQYGVKVVVYLLATVWIIYTLFVTKVV